MTLRAIASGATPAAGMWSVVSDRSTSRFFALVGGPDGPVVHELVATGGARVQLGPGLGGPRSDFAPVALGAPAAGIELLGAWTPEAVPVPTAAGAVVHDPALADEPDPPLVLRGGIESRPVPAALGLTSGAVAVVGSSGVLSGQLDGWSVRQHGVDDEADHLTRLTVRRDGETVVVVDDLDRAGVAMLAGPRHAPVLSVADGHGALRVHRSDGRRAPDLPDEPGVAATWAQGTPVAARVGAGGLVEVAPLEGARWGRWRPVDDSAGTRSLLAVGGSSHLVAADPSGTRLIDLGAR